MRFSIIIPFYNTKKEYFSRMIDSLKAQIFKDFEIIIVNDGSKNESTVMLNNFDYSGLKVHIVNQKNSGPSSARNNGITKSKGEYIVFVDSDDILPQNSLSEADIYIKEYNCPDVIFGKLIYYGYRNGAVYRLTEFDCPKEFIGGYLGNLAQSNTPALYYDKEHLYKVKIKLLHQDDESIILGSASANIYKSSIVKDCLFNENIWICEDQIFNRMILNDISNCLIVPDEWYFYIQYQDSSLHNHTHKINLSTTFAYWDKIAELDKDESKEVKRASNVNNVGLFCNEIKNMVTYHKYNECKTAIKKMYDHPVIKIALADENFCEYPINKFKLYLLKHNFLGVLFFAYMIKNKLF